MTRSLSQGEEQFDRVFARLGGWCDPGPFRDLLKHTWHMGDRLVLGILDDPGVNAAVTRTRDGMYFLGMSRGLFSGDGFGRSDHTIDAWIGLLRGSRTFHQYRGDREFWLVLRTSTHMFVKMHEIGHLSYGHLEERDDGTAAIQELGKTAGRHSQRSHIDDHAIEVAADSHAALAYLPLLPTTSPMSMERQLIALTAGLTGLFLNYWSDSDTHPHPSVRLACLFRFIEEAVLQSKLPDGCQDGIVPAVDSVNRLIADDGNLLAIYLHERGARASVRGIDEADLTRACRQILERLQRGGLAAPRIRVF